MPRRRRQWTVDSEPWRAAEVENGAMVAGRSSLVLTLEGTLQLTGAHDDGFPTAPLRRAPVSGASGLRTRAHSVQRLSDHLRHRAFLCLGAAACLTLNHPIPPPFLHAHLGQQRLPKGTRKGLLKQTIHYAERLGPRSERR